MKLTKNFNRSEFECKDGSPMTENQFVHYDIRGIKAK